MNVWFTADLHLGHGNIIKFCNRPFLSAEEQERVRTERQGKWHVSEETVRRHDEAILDAINGCVQPDDILWMLGDFCWGDLARATQYRERVHCRHVHLVWGNHDHHSIRPLFEEVLEQGMIAVEGQEIWLNHYPMRSWHKSFHGSWHLYGHVHARLTAEDDAKSWLLTKDVGVDACGYQPISFEMLRAYMRPRMEKFKERKATLGDG